MPNSLQPVRQIVTIKVPGDAVARMLREQLRINDQSIPADATVQFDIDIAGWTLKSARVSWQEQEF